MANTQIDITTNGTTTLATAGKYCDRNIDVNVNVSGVGAEPTQFTNYYRPEWVTIDKNTGYSSSGGYTISNDSESNYIRIPYHHMTNEPFVLRMRGINPPRSRMGIIVWAEDGETAVNWGSFNGNGIKSYDEYGDIVIAFSDTSSFVGRDWYYVEFNFQYIGYSSATEVIASGPIITINEPIGNGGHV